MDQKKNRKLRIYLEQGGKTYPFCWASFLKDNSLSFGFIPKNIKFTEYGTAIYKSSKFIRHQKNVISERIKKVKTPHITFHPPKISQQWGVVNFTTPEGKFDTWNLDWFPVHRKQLMLCVIIKDFQKIILPARPKQYHQIVFVPLDISSFRMNLEIDEIYMKNNKPIVVHDGRTFGNIYGRSPKYEVYLRFYSSNPLTTTIYIANEA